MLRVANELVPWLIEMMDERGWSQRELARRTDVSSTTVSNVITYQRLPTWEFCAAVARALSVPPEEVFALAGLMRPPPAPVDEEGEALGLLRRLPRATRAMVVQMLRGLVHELAPDTVGEVGPGYHVDEPLVAELVAEFQQIPDDWKEVALEQVAQLRKLAERPPARIVGVDDGG